MPASHEVRMKRLERQRKLAKEVVAQTIEFLRDIGDDLDNLGPINHAILSSLDEAEFAAGHTLAKPYLAEVREALGQLGPRLAALQEVAVHAVSVPEGEKESDLDWAVGDYKPMPF